MPLRNKLLEMGGKPIKGVADAVNDDEAVNKGQMDTAIAAEIAAAAHDAVTLAGTPDYITIAGQVITRGSIVLTTDVSGVLPIANMATGTPDGTKFVRDDGTLANPDEYPWTESTLTSDATSTSASYADVGAELSIAVSANTNYLVRYDLMVYNFGGSDQIMLAVNGPASPTSMYVSAEYSAGTAAAGKTAYDDYVFFGPAAEIYTYVPIFLVFNNGSNAGTLALRFKLNSLSTGNAKVLAGSHVRYRVR